MQKRNAYRRLLTFCGVLIMLMGICRSSLTNVNALTKEDDAMFNYYYHELGYSIEVADDQVYEEYYHVDGLNSTGGIDGLLLNGSPAPNAQCGIGAEMNANPTPAPTAEPTVVPTPVPTAVPTAVPTVAPTTVPEQSEMPTSAPTVEPTMVPTAEPTVVPTVAPTAGPTVEPAKECKVHDWFSEIVREATCLEKGLLTKTCKECGKVEELETDTTAHDYRLKETVAGDCKTHGTETFVCEFCGDTFADDGPLGEHAYEKSADSIEPSCGKEGVYNYTCSTCGDTYSEQQKALVHEYTTEKEMVEYTTCITDGRKGYRCMNCGDVRDEEILPAPGHKFTDIVWEVKPAGTFTPGVGEIRCAKCNAVKETVEIPSELPLWSLFGAIACFVAAIVIHAKRKSKEQKRG